MLYIIIYGVEHSRTCAVESIAYQLQVVKLFGPYILWLYARLFKTNHFDYHRRRWGDIFFFNNSGYTRGTLYTYTMRFYNSIVRPEPACFGHVIIAPSSSSSSPLSI